MGVYEGGRSNQKSFLMRGVIVHPYKLIVQVVVPPKGGFLIMGGFLIRGRRLLTFRVFIVVAIAS